MKVELHFKLYLHSLCSEGEAGAKSRKTFGLCLSIRMPDFSIVWSSDSEQFWGRKPKLACHNKFYSMFWSVQFLGFFTWMTEKKKTNNNKHIIFSSIIRFDGKPLWKMLLKKKKKKQQAMCKNGFRNLAHTKKWTKVRETKIELVVFCISEHVWQYEIII